MKKLFDCYGVLYNKQPDKCCTCVLENKCHISFNTIKYKNKRMVKNIMKKTCFASKDPRTDSVCKDVCAVYEECLIVFELLQKGADMGELKEQDISQIKGTPINGVKKIKSESKTESRGIYEIRKIGIEGSVTTAVKNRKRNEEPLNKETNHQRWYRNTGNPFSKGDPRHIRWDETLNPWDVKGKMGKMFESIKEKGKVVIDKERGVDHVLSRIIDIGTKCGFLVVSQDNNNEYLVKIPEISSQNENEILISDRVEDNNIDLI